MNRQRNNIVQGLFYPSEANALSGLFEQPGEPLSAPKASGALVPHASYDHILEKTLPVYRSLRQNQIESIFIISPVHREKEKAFFLPEYTSFATPLGDVDADSEGIRFLLSRGEAFRQINLPHDEEHGIEVHLPLVKFFFPGVPVLPLLYGVPGITRAKALGQALKAYGKEKKVLFLLSGNCSGYGRKDQVALKAGEMARLLNTGDWRTLAETARTDPMAGCASFGAAALLFSGLEFQGLDSWFSSSPENKNEKKTAAYGTGFFMPPS